MPANDVYELSIDQLLQGQNLTNVHHCIQIGSDGTGDARAAVTLWWDEHFKENWLDCIVTAVSMVQTRVRRLQPTQTQTLITAATGDGDVLGEGLPSQSCGIIRTYAVPLARRGTGHVKVPGIDIAVTAAGKIDAATESIWNAFAVEMQTDLTETTTGYIFRMGVYSTIDEVLRPIVLAKARPRIKTCHSRSMGVGN